MSNSDSNTLIGQNYIEVVEFSLERHLPDGSVIKGLYGAEVDKVREVIKMPKINRQSTRLEGVEGVFELRGIPIPAINLAIILGDKKAPIHSNHQIVISEFDMKRAGFIVNSTHRIKRIPAKNIMPAAADAGSCISGMTLVGDDEFLFIIDFEKVLAQLEQASISKIISKGTQVVTDSVIEYYSNNLTKNTSKKILVLTTENKELLLQLKAWGYLIEVVTNIDMGRNILEESLLGKYNSMFDVVIADINIANMKSINDFFNWVNNKRLLNHLPRIVIFDSVEAKNLAQNEISFSDVFILKDDLQDIGSFLQTSFSKKSLNSAS